jgi:tRNA(Ile)-lysidine synthase TilS/MesJ
LAKNAIKHRATGMLRNLQQHHIKKIRKKAGRAINRYSMLGAGDRVLVALSGGKDSLTLLDVLSERLKYLPITYEIIAAHVTVECIPSKSEIGYLQNFCSERGIALHVRNIAVDIDLSSAKSVCFFCSLHRRKALFRLMGELGCSRLAFGHHMDDIIETLIMNMAIHGKFSTMPPRLPLFSGEFDIIRPLCLLHEQEVEQYCRLRGFTPAETACPYGDNSMRAAAKRLILEMEKLSRRARSNIFSSMLNIDHEYLPSEDG